MNDSLSRRDVSRRTIVKGAAWSVPVVAATVAVPAYAASPDCAGTATVTANGSELTMQTVTLPACARTVTYVVAGGAGGSGNCYSGTGSMLVGSFSVSGGETLTLYAGGGGRGRDLEPARATGFTNGGMGTIAYWTYDQHKMLLAGGGGGASSAIVLGAPGGTPLLVAGGGGGGPEEVAWSAGGSDGGVTVRVDGGWGGNAEPDQGNVGPGRMMGDKITYGPDGEINGNLGPDWRLYLTEFAYHGTPGTLTTAGTGGQVVLSGTNPGDGSRPFGASGLDADPTSGDGGDAAATHGDVNPDDANAFFGGSGGGGGGWRGGGGGASMWFVNQSGVGTGGGGGSGSNYYGGATPGSTVAIGSVSLPYPSSVELSNQPWGDRMGAPGMVTITWS